jgi:hypothetical protein
MQGTYVSSCFGPSSGNSTRFPSSFAFDPSVQNHIRNRTLFVLGIMLIELCLNRSFQNLKADLLKSQNLSGNSCQNTTPQSLISFEDIGVAYKLVDNVYLDAGDEYGNAVQRCLRCGFDGRVEDQDFKLPQFRKNFFRGVVAPVQATYDMMPS